MKKKILLYLILISFMKLKAQDNINKESPGLIEVAAFDHFQAIGVAASTNSLFISFPHRQPYEYGVAEIVNGRRVPYPDKEWNRYDSTHPQNHFINVQALWADDANSLWILDPANPDDAPAIVNGVKLLQIDLTTDTVEKVYRFEDLPLNQSALNDVRIDTRRQLAYLSDPKLASIVVLDLATGKSRIVLRQNATVLADTYFRLHLDGKDVIDNKGNSFSSNVNGIALTRDGAYFYFRAINQLKLYRIATQYLADATLSDAVLAMHVEAVAQTGVSHGMISDSKSNIYLTDSPDKATICNA